MAWLERLDARAAHWSTPTRWLYAGTKWYLVGLGGFAVFRLLLDRVGIWSLY